MHRGDVERGQTFQSRFRIERRHTADVDHRDAGDEPQHEQQAQRNAEVAVEEYQRASKQLHGRRVVGLGRSGAGRAGRARVLPGTDVLQRPREKFARWARAQTEPFVATTQHSTTAYGIKSDLDKTASEMQSVIYGRARPLCSRSRGAFWQHRLSRPARG